MLGVPLRYYQKPNSLITEEIRSGWRTKIQELLEMAIEQCEEIQAECDMALNGLKYSLDDDGKCWYDDLETAKEISRDEGHAMNLRAVMESQLSCLDDLFSGSMSGCYSFPPDIEDANTLPW